MRLQKEPMYDNSIAAVLVCPCLLFNMFINHQQLLQTIIIAPNQLVLNSLYRYKLSLQLKEVWNQLDNYTVCGIDLHVSKDQQKFIKHQLRSRSIAIGSLMCMPRLKHMAQARVVCMYWIIETQLNFLKQMQANYV